jgi:hypothetical protein
LYLVIFPDQTQVPHCTPRMFSLNIRLIVLLVIDIEDLGLELFQFRVLKDLEQERQGILSLNGSIDAKLDSRVFNESFQERCHIGSEVVEVLSDLEVWVLLSLRKEESLTASVED